MEILDTDQTEEDPEADQPRDSEKRLSSFGDPGQLDKDIDFIFEVMQQHMVDVGQKSALMHV